jgi:hypothetical protein
MKNLFNRSILGVIMGLFLCSVTTVQAVNSTTTDIWPFDAGTADQVDMYATGTESYFSVNWADKGRNLTYKNKSINYAINYTRFQPTTQASATDGQSKVIEQIYYTVEGKKILTIDVFKGYVIVRAIYDDGHVETRKIMK